MYCTDWSMLRNFGILIAFILFFMTTYLLIAEFVMFDHSKGEVLVFQRKSQAVSAIGHAAHDEESGKSEAATTAEHAAVSDRELHLQLQSNTLHWKDVCYDVPIKGEMRRISDHIDGWVTPGTLTALMVGYLLASSQSSQY